MIDLVQTRRSLSKKWTSVAGPLSIKGVEDPIIKENLAVLLENQENKDFDGSMMNESANLSVGGLNGATAGDWKFQPIALALVRRTFPDLFANKCVGVQAMPGPVGLAFALRITYNDSNGAEAGWDQVPGYGGFSGTPGSSAANTLTSSGLSGDGLSSFTPFGPVAGISDTSGTGLATSAGENLSIGGGTMRQLSMRIERKAIEAQTRKLAASYTLESAQDIKAMYGLDVEREMINYLQYEITAELDRELIYAMKRVATNPDPRYGGAVFQNIDVLSSASGITQTWGGQGEKFMNIVSAIINQANNLAITTRRGAGNFVVVSPRIATALQGAGHQFIQYTAKVNATVTSAPIGKLNGTIEVYRDQYATTDYALVGYKGATISDAGIIFAPYIMGLTMRAVEPNSFYPSIGTMSRYAVVDNLLGAGRYYRLINFTNVGALIAGATPIASGLVSGL